MILNNRGIAIDSFSKVCISLSHVNVRDILEADHEVNAFKIRDTDSSTREASKRMTFPFKENCTSFDVPAFTGRKPSFETYDAKAYL